MRSLGRRATRQFTSISVSSLHQHFTTILLSLFLWTFIASIQSSFHRSLAPTHQSRTEKGWGAVFQRAHLAVRSVFHADRRRLRPMDMDSSHQHQNWLAFSLSNHRLPSHSSLSLFQPFNLNPNPNPSGVVELVRAEENGTASTPATTDFSSLLNCNSPKLEDFLGGAGASSSSSEVVCQQLTAGETSSTAAVATTDQMYDSELKTIAASFLRGYSAGQTETHKQLLTVAPPPAASEPPAKKPVENFGQRTSIYRGVTRHRWTGRYEAHLWDNTCRREGQSRKGRQGGYDKEEKAARTYDLAALKYWGPTTTTNFPVSNYEMEIKDMKHMTRQEFVASLRRKSSGFSRGASIYRGVTRHHQHGRWQARIGRVAGNKDLYLGTFSTQEEAAEAYDIAAIKFRGLNAVTNFDISRYDVKSIASSNLPIGGMTNKSKTSSDQSLSDNKSSDDRDLSSGATSVSFANSQTSPSTLSFGMPPNNSHDFWTNFGYQTPNFHNPKPAPMPNFNVDFPTTSCVSETSNNNGYFSEGYFGQQINQQSNAIASTTSAVQSAVVPMVTRIAINSNIGSSYEESCYGDWINSPSPHSFQSAKSNLSAFQTPIFGME